MHQRLFQGHRGKLFQPQHKLKPEHVNRGFFSLLSSGCLNSMLGCFHSDENTFFLLVHEPLLCLKCQRKLYCIYNNRTHDNFFCIALFPLIFLVAYRIPCFSPHIFLQLQCGQFFFYNKGIIYECLKTLATLYPGQSLSFLRLTGTRLLKLWDQG